MVFFSKRKVVRMSSEMIKCLSVRALEALKFSCPVTFLYMTTSFASLSTTILVLASVLLSVILFVLKETLSKENVFSVTGL